MRGAWLQREAGARIPWWYWVIRWFDPTPERVRARARKRWLGAVLATAALAGGCVSQPPAPVLVSALPPKVDVAKLVPPADTKPIEEVGERFDDTPIDGGRYCPADRPKDCHELPPGILVDETTYARFLAATSERDRLRAENGALWSVRASERQAAEDVERAYQKRVVEQSAELERMRGRWVPLVSALAGALVVIAGIEIFGARFRGAGPDAGGASSGPATGR